MLRRQTPTAPPAPPPSLFYTVSQGCCDLSEELNWDTVFTDSGRISLSSLFSLVLCPSTATALGPVVLCRTMGAEGRGLKTSLPKPVLPTPLLQSQHAMCLGDTCTSAYAAVKYGPGKMSLGRGSHTSLGTANPVIQPFPVTK